MVDNAIALYDNILVGRKRSVSSKGLKSFEVETTDPEEIIAPEEITQYEKYADLLDFNPNLIFMVPQERVRPMGP